MRQIFSWIFSQLTRFRRALTGQEPPRRRRNSTVDMPIVRLCRAKLLQPLNHGRRCKLFGNPQELPALYRPPHGEPARINGERNRDYERQGNRKQPPCERGIPEDGRGHPANGKQCSQPVPIHSFGPSSFAIPRLRIPSDLASEQRQ